MPSPNQKQVKEYRTQQVLTAPKEQLLLMLVDGAVRFSERARERLEAKDYAEFGSACIRAQRIMTELICSLRKDLIGEELYTNLVGLYHFVYTRLVEGNLHRDAAKLEEALRILGPVRQMWHDAVAKDLQVKRQEGGEPAPAAAPRPAAPPGGGLSITG